MMPSIPAIPITVLILGLLATIVPPPTCERGRAEHYEVAGNMMVTFLDVDARSRIGRQSGREVPMGGMVAGALRAPASQCGPRKSWPGPKHHPHSTPDPCAKDQW